MKADFVTEDYPDFRELFRDPNVAIQPRVSEEPEDVYLDAEPEAQGDQPVVVVAGIYRLDSRRLQHNRLAQRLMDDWSACFIGGAPAIWNGERFEYGWDGIDRAANMLDDEITGHELKEVQGYISRNAPCHEPADPRYIAFRNGVLDVETGELMGATNVLYMPNVIPCDYDPDVYDAAVDRFLNDVSCGDKVIRANIEEMVGACFYRGKINGQCPILVGDGSNGKSTLLNALTRVLGPENVSSLDMASIGKQFHVGCLAGKLANIGDDISNGHLKGDGLSVFKKAATGERLHADVKMGTPYDFAPYATLVFSCNEFPSLGDNSDGMMRRLFPIPFNARFSPSTPGFDPRIEAKLTTESALKYFCRLGVEGLRRMLANSGFTASKLSEAIVKEIRYDNDNTLQWLEEREYNAAILEGEAIQQTYNNYRAWCDEAGLKAYGRTKFTQKINKRFGFESKNAKVGFPGEKAQMRVFAKKA